LSFETLLEDRLAFVGNEYSRSDFPWVIGYSGGKDSSLVLKIVFEAISRLRKRSSALHIVYCDTGVEIPVVAGFVRSTLRGIQRQAVDSKMPITCHLARPPMSDRFFVRVIGRGYPPPTNKFRWCTDKLRIRPIQHLMRTLGGTCNVVVLGVRDNESEERRRTLSRNATQEPFYYRQSQSESRILFCPIVDFDVTDVWDGLHVLERPTAINVQQLAALYKQASGECPVVRDAAGTPCGQGRFGCWTCTVVRQDRAVQGLVQEGYAQLKPLLNFRNWLMAIRDQPEHRCAVRRNGAPGPGPFRIKTRKVILQHLLAAQRKSGIRLIMPSEMHAIRALWALDARSSSYSENAA
jgi:DNA sulfur modification protein DndC